MEIPKTSIECLEISNDSRYGKFVIEPLDRGFGITIGNALRRVLLSSLEGAAVTSIKIDGVLHEFSPIKNVVEDTTDLILNLKDLRLKVYSNETKLLRIEKDGEGDVFAKDIETDSEIEILNPDLKIATVAPGGRLSVEMTVAVGKGFVTAEKNKKHDDPIGLIPIDSIYSPIKKVSYKVDDYNVGLTESDKLTIELWTDGSIRPDHALSKAAQIVIDYMSIFTNLAVDVMENSAVSSNNEEKKNKVLEMTIEDLDLSPRASNCLKRAGLSTVEELILKSTDELKKVRNLGNKSLEEIIEKLKELGYSLNDGN